MFFGQIHIAAERRSARGILTQDDDRAKEYQAQAEQLDELLAQVYAEIDAVYPKDANGHPINMGDPITAKFRTKEGVQHLNGSLVMDEWMWCLRTRDEHYSINRLHDIENLQYGDSAR